MKILICAILLSLISCNSSSYDDYRHNYMNEVIIIIKIEKTYHKGIVRYYTMTYSHNSIHAGGFDAYKRISFLDSVNKFSIGDTITFIKK